MKKVPTGTVIVIIVCIFILGILAYVSMTTGTEIPSAVIGIFSSLVSGLIGYEVGRNG